MQVTVVYPVTVDIGKINKDKLVTDDDYKEEIRGRIFDVAADILANNTIKPLIQDCEIEELID